MDVQHVTISRARSMNVQCAGCTPLHCQEYGRAGCVLFYRQQYGCAGCVSFHSQQNGRAACNHFESKKYERAVCRVYAFTLPGVWTYRPTGCVPFYASNKDVQGVPLFKWRTVRHPVIPLPEWTKIPMPEPVRYRNKGTQSGTGMLRYRTEIQDAGMPMASTSMTMPSYVPSPQSGT